MTAKKPRSMTIKFTGTPEQNTQAFSHLCEALTWKRLSPDWVIEIDAVNGPCFVSNEDGAPGLTHNIKKATRYETENLVREVCTSLRMKYQRTFTPRRLA